MKRHALQKDLNQPEIVEALRRIGATVKVMHTPLDLLVGYRGRNFLLECKQERKKGWKDELKPAQVKFIAEWRGQFAIVYTAQEAVDLVLHL